MIIKGDVSGDGKITDFDLSIIQAALLENLVLNEEQQIAADTNNDGKISIVDLARIQKHLLGIEIINEVIE